MCDTSYTGSYVSIKKHHYKIYNVNGVNFEDHPNAYRMKTVCDYIQYAVAPNIDAKVDISGNYKIELHDTIQPGDTSQGCFCFCKKKTDSIYTLIPDEYQLQNYGGMLKHYPDSKLWGEKKSKALFCGTSTGDTNPLMNQRLNACDWAVRHASSYAEFYITKVAQMNKSDIVKSFPQTSKLFLKDVQIPVPSHYQYRYLVNIAGNTCCWNRLPMIMNSNSLLLNVYHPDMCWYYPALREELHYVPVSLIGCDLYNTMQYYDANPFEARMITRNANAFVDQFLCKSSTVLYTTLLFENIAYYYKK